MNILTDFNSALKEIYQPGQFIEQFSKQKELIKRIKGGGGVQSGANFKLIRTAGGLGYIVPIKTGRLWGASWIGDGGAYPVSQNAQVDRLQVTTKTLSVRHSISNKALAEGSKDFQAMVSILDDITTSMPETAEKVLNGALYRTANGYITTVNGAVTASTSVVVTSLLGLEVGMPLDIFTATTAGIQQVAGAKISSIAVSTKTLTMDTVCTITTGAYVYLAGSRGISITGFADHFATSGTVAGIDKAAKSWYQGNLGTATVGTINDMAIQNLVTAALKQKEDAPGRFFLTTYEVRQQIWNKVLRPLQQNMDTDIAGGIKTFKYNGLDVVPDLDCTAGYMFLIDPATFGFLQSQDMQFNTLAGANLMPIPGYSGNDISFEGYIEFMCNRPNANPYSYGITES